MTKWVLAALLLLGAVPADAQLQVTKLRGTVVDAQRLSVAGARVMLQDSAHNSVATVVSRADGAFEIDDVAPGSYVVRVEVQGAPVLSRPLVVRGSLPVDLTLTIGPALHENVVVRGDADANTVERPWTLGGDALRRVSEPIPSQRLQSTLASLPGWMAEDNGLLHVRGVDDGILFVQDGVPIYERLDRLFGLPPDTSGIASMNVLDGYIPPEFGFKSGGVVEVRSVTGVSGPWAGTVDVGVGSSTTGHVNALAAGPFAASGGLMITGSHERSSRFLDPVDFDNFHNTGQSTSGSGQVTWHTSGDLFTGSVQHSVAAYDVPHSLEQELAGQDQRQDLAQTLVTGTWQRIVSDRTVWQASAYWRGGEATLFPSPQDTPVTASAERRNDRSGAVWSLTHQRRRHTFKIGLELSGVRLDEQFSFAVTDPDEAEAASLSDAAIAHDPENPFVFAGRRTARLWSVFAQDALRVSDRLTVNFGVRADRSTMLVTASQVSPRVGVSYQLAANTTVRGSFLRLYQPPQAEYLLLASSEAARELSPFAGTEVGGGSAIPPERQTALDASVSQQMTGWTVDGAVWRRSGRDVDDPNVFFGTTVTVPNSVAKQEAWGFTLRADIQPRHGWSGTASYSHVKVVQYGPITGGLFLEDEVAAIADGTRFTPDHDQRHALSASASYADDRRHWRAAGAFRYQTGTPVGVDDEGVDELLGRRGSTVVDFESGRVRPRATLDAQVDWVFHRGSHADLTWTGWITNITNQTYAFNFGNPFSGTHFGSPRRYGVSLRVNLRGATPAP